MAYILRVITEFSTAIVDYFFTTKRRRSFYFTWFVGFSLIGFLSVYLFISIWVDFNAVRQLKDYTPPIPSKVLDRKGRLITTFFKDHRIMVTMDEVPDVLPQAFIAMEDNRFYEHHGINPSAMFRAFLKNLVSGGISQGGSTITQQLTKVVLTDGSRTYTRKIKEAFMSLYLDYTYTKDEILNMYFNQIYFGHGNYGVEAASRFYFGKPVAEISLGQAAILASLPSAPNGYSPIKYPHKSQEKVRQVLLKMVDMGYISLAGAEEEFRELLLYYGSLNISPNETAFGRRVDLAPYYTEHIRRDLVKKYGEEMLYQKGLIIETSLDLDHQAKAQQTLWKTIAETNEKSPVKVFSKQIEMSEKYSESAHLIQTLFGYEDFAVQRSLEQYEVELYYHSELAENFEILSFALGADAKLNKTIDYLRKNNPYAQYYSTVQGAFIEIDNKTGEITAMVGGTPFSATNQINRTVQMKRQPGSTFKPILYAAAIELRQITAASIFPDTPLIMLDVGGDVWMPENYSLGYRGFISVRDALRLSINMVSIAITREVGLGNMFPIIARQLYVDPKEIPYNLSVALGSYEVSPLQLARAFSLFPRGGLSLHLITIKKISDKDGNVYFDALKDGNVEPVQLLQPGTASLMVSLLKDVVYRGTGSLVRRNYRGFAGGKTGTTNNYRDAWFVGFNQRYTSAIWVGFDKPTISLGSGQAGGAVSAPAWGYYQYLVQQYLINEKPHIVTSSLRVVTICKTTGMLPGPTCPETATEVFVPGTEPTQTQEEVNGETTFVDPTLDPTINPPDGTNPCFTDPNIMDLR
ncbi:MAG: PBP1A family penicillin-binding protein [Leptospirales bacterium]